MISKAARRLKITAWEKPPLALRLETRATAEAATMVANTKEVRPVARSAALGGLTYTTSESFNPRSPRGGHPPARALTVAGWLKPGTGKVRLSMGQIKQKVASRRDP